MLGLCEVSLASVPLVFSHPGKEEVVEYIEVMRVDEWAHFVLSSSASHPGRPATSVCSIVRSETSPRVALRIATASPSVARAVAEDREHEALSEEVLHCPPLPINKGIARAVLVCDRKEQPRRLVPLHTFSARSAHHADLALLTPHNRPSRHCRAVQRPAGGAQSRLGRGEGVIVRGGNPS